MKSAESVTVWSALVVSDLSLVSTVYVIHFVISSPDSSHANSNVEYRGINFWYEFWLLHFTNWRSLRRRHVLSKESGFESRQGYKHCSEIWLIEVIVRFAVKVSTLTNPIDNEIESRLKLRFEMKIYNALRKIEAGAESLCRIRI